MFFLFLLLYSNTVGNALVRSTSTSVGNAIFRSAIVLKLDMLHFIGHFFLGFSPFALCDTAAAAPRRAMPAELAEHGGYDKSAPPHPI